MPSSFSATEAIPLSARWSEWDNRDRFVAGLTCPVLENRRVCFSRGGISISPFSLGQRPQGEHYLQRSRIAWGSNCVHGQHAFGAEYGR